MKVLINIDLTQSAIALDFEGKKVAFSFEMFQYMFGDYWDVYSFQEWKDMLKLDGAHMVNIVASMCGIESGIFQITYNII
jgi:hypothetical protein